MKTIGILAQYLDSRNDIRQFVSDMSNEYKVVLYVNASDTKYKKLLKEDVEVRVINNIIRKSIFNNILILLFKFFGHLPKTANNYFITEEFKIYNSNLSKLGEKVELLILRIIMVMPKFISYDRYLSLLRYKKNTQIDDVETFICFTQIYNDLFYAQLLKSGKKVITYVYSWDHPCKMKCFSKKINKYVVWNEGLKNDLIELQGIDAEQIQIIGSTQLTYIDDYKKSKESTHELQNKQYFYYACATGSPVLVKLEVELIREISSFVKLNFPDKKLLVRPYPFLKKWDTYSSLSEHDNILFDNDFRVADNFSVANDKIKEKFILMEGAIAVIHVGTTFGFEAAYFDRPVIFLDLLDPVKAKPLFDFTHQYQNDKYLNTGYDNVIKSYGELKAVIDNMLIADYKYLAYNNSIRQAFPILSMSEILQKFSEIIIKSYN